MQPLALFFHDQIARVRRTLASATPTQRFSVAVLPSEPPHGTNARYELGCRCHVCFNARAVYCRHHRRQQYRITENGTRREIRRHLSAHHISQGAG